MFPSQIVAIEMMSRAATGVNQPVDEIPENLSHQLGILDMRFLSEQGRRCRRNGETNTCNRLRLREKGGEPRADAMR